MTNPATNLRAAAAYLDEHGWAQKTYRTPDGAVCVGRALNLTGASMGAFLAFWAFTGWHQAHQEWNDHPGRTVGEVKAALLGAAEAFEREHQAAVRGER